MNTKHTPGPWILHEDGRSIYTDHTNTAGMFSIAQGFSGNAPDMDRANLALAAAAPDLLAALEATYKHLRNNADATVEASDIYNTVCAALAKATAQQ